MLSILKQPRRACRRRHTSFSGLLLIARWAGSSHRPMHVRCSRWRSGRIHAQYGTHKPTLLWTSKLASWGPNHTPAWSSASALPKAGRFQMWGPTCVTKRRDGRQVDTSRNYSRKPSKANEGQQHHTPATSRTRLRKPRPATRLPGRCTCTTPGPSRHNTRIQATKMTPVDKQGPASAAGSLIADVGLYLSVLRCSSFCDGVRL